MELNTFHLFAGAGGGLLADELLGHRVVGAVEIESYPRKVLLARQLDGSLPRFPIWNDVTTFRSDNPECASYIARLRALRNLCISGGFPCQDISSAGKGAGIEGERSGLWSEFARIIGEIMPRYVYVENSPMLTIRGLGTVLRDLAEMGFDAEWGVLSAADVGAHHLRERIWIVGHADDHGQAATKIRTSTIKGSDDSKARQKQASEFTRPSEQHAELAYAISNGRHQRWNNDREHDRTIVNSNGESQEDVCNTSSIGQQGSRKSIKQCCEAQDRDRKASFIKSVGQRSQWSTEPDVGRVANGVAFGVDRLKAIGNGQVPLCAATAFELLRDRIE
jgi:DNA (cytosine-5)-methyltransferase 1